MPRVRQWIVDIVLAGLLVAAGFVQLVSDGGLTPFAVLGMLGMTLPVAWRHIAPFTAVTVGWGVLLLEEGFGGDITSQGYGAVIALTLTLYTAAAHTDRRRALAAVAVALLCDWLAVALADEPSVASFAFTTLIVIAPWGAGRIIRDRQQHIDELRSLSAALEREREERVREATIAERERMGREMHDVLTHTLSVMVVQLGAVTRVLERDPVAARSTIESVRSTGKDALAELRFLLGLQSPGSGPGSAPNPGLAQIEELAEAMRRSGLPTDIRLDIRDGGVERLPQPIDLAAYRIVQEALTNTLRHAPGASATVTIGITGDRLDVLVSDSGGQPRLPAANGGGHGIDGMRARARLCGGELTAAPDPAGGFTVHALLPTGAMS